MANSTVVDVAVGMFFVYAMFSSVCSLLNEYIQRVLDKRAKHLEHALQVLLADHEGKLFAEVKQHALVRVIAHSPTRMPSYLPSSTFTHALFEALVHVDSEHPLTFAGVREAIQRLPDGTDVKAALLSLSNAAGNDLVALRKQVEKWFDDAMDRLSGTYKRHVTTWIFALGFLVAAGTNMDTILLVQRLEHEAALRSTVASHAEVATQKRAADQSHPATAGVAEGSAGSIPGATPDPAELAASTEELKQLDLLFWDTTQMTSAGDEARHPLAMRRPEWSGSWLWWVLLKLIGFGMTALAVSLGAPFWFDLLGRIVNLRATGAKPAKTVTSSAEPAKPTPPADAGGQSKT